MNADVMPAATVRRSYDLIESVRAGFDFNPNTGFLRRQRDAPRARD
jgi:hypothetical protein